MIIKYFQKNNINRTQKANLNTIISLFFRGGSILLSFILVPLTINYIKPDAYGIWITLSSLVGWFAIFDIGIGNGLKNKLSESLADQNYEKSRMYVSTTYVIITLIAFFLVCIYLVLYQFVSWQSIFNSAFIPEKELRDVVTIVAILFLLKFVTDLINVVSAAFQMVSVSSVLLFLSNLSITISVWVLTRTTSADMVLLAFSLSFIPFFISVIASVYLFSHYFKKVKPSIKYVNFKESKSIISLGSQFFILQIIVLVIFQTDNILIAQFFNTTEVTKFNIAYKYYSIIIIVFSAILNPYWTAFTEAYSKEDFLWIKKSINRLIKIFIISFAISILMMLVASSFFKIWVGDQIVIPLSLSFSLCIYIAVMNLSSIFANFLNGIGKMRLQVILAPFVGVLNISLSFLFVKGLNFGISAIPLANALSLILGAILGYIQYSKIINRKPNGIWGK